MATWYSRVLTLGMTGADVELVQRKLRSPVTGTYNAETASRVRGVQWADKLPVTGMVDSVTADRIGESVRTGLTPDWYTRELGMRSDGPDVQQLRAALGLHNHGPYDQIVEATVRRFQSAHHLPLTGRVCETDAVALSDDVPWAG